jgi:hypothetical protein
VSEDDEESGFGEEPPTPKLFESRVKLKDIYDSTGRHRQKAVAQDTNLLLPLIYLYDFGVSRGFLSSVALADHAIG